MTITIKDVARLAGVSVATVSRTLSAPDVVTESTRKKVMAAVEQTGYVTNALASNFRRRRSQNIVVLVPDISNPFFSSIIQGIELVAMKSHYRILLGDTQQSVVRERAYSELVLQRQADGIICLGMNIPFEYDCRRKNPDPKWPPIVMACEYSGDIPLPTVLIDNRQAAKEVVEHLIELGHKNIAYINGPKDSPLSRDRQKGFKAAMKKASLKVEQCYIAEGDFSLVAGYAAAVKLLKTASRPTALFCANDKMAIGAMNAARDSGLRIPEDLSVAGFDDIDFASYSYPPLTTIHQPRARIGMRAMEIMLQCLEGKKPPQSELILPHELIVRGSTGPVAIQ